jgi:hypothetical protein
MEKHKPDLETIERLSGHDDLWHSRLRSDASDPQVRSPVEHRERISALAFVKGPCWYARKLLDFQVFGNSRESSRALIQNSRRLLEDSRSAISKTKNLLAFSRHPREFIN